MVHVGIVGEMVLVCMVRHLMHLAIAKVEGLSFSFSNARNALAWSKDLVCSTNQVQKYVMTMVLRIVLLKIQMENGIAHIGFYGVNGYNGVADGKILENALGEQVLVKAAGNLKRIIVGMNPW